MSSGASSLGQIQVRRWQGGDDALWNEYVRRHELGSPFHTMEWKRCIERTFGFHQEYLLAEQGGSVVGVLPLFLVSNLLSGKTLISTPFAVYGGVLCDGDAARQALREAVERLSRELGVQYTELRNAHEGQVVGWERVDRYATFTQEIGPDEAAILAALPRETRRMTRRALENPYEVTKTRATGSFYDLYTQNLRRLGTPAFPKRHFERLLEEFPDSDVREIRLGEKMAAVVMSLYWKDQVLPYYGASDPELNHANPNNFMYYDLMRSAGQQGLRLFDFGRSKKGSGSYSFKSRWGMTERELPYEVLLVKRTSLPNFSPNNPKFELALKIWRKLPLAVTRFLGPRLIRLVP